MLINCCMFFYSCSRVPTVPNRTEMALKSFPISPPFQIFFSLLSIFSLFFLFPICCKLKIVPQKAITAVVKSLHITARLYTQTLCCQYNCLQLLVPAETRMYRKLRKVTQSGQKYREAPNCGLCHLLRALLPELLIFSPAPGKFWGEKFKTACTSFINVFDVKFLSEISKITWSLSEGFWSPWPVF